jgi:putative ABC transport system substrate-binding protein
MNRREFVVTLGGVATTWPLAARAQQQSGMPIIGYLSVRSNDNYLAEALRRGLRETGYVEGQNVAIEYRWAMGQYDRMPAMAAELTRLPLAVLVNGRRRACGTGRQGCDLHHSRRLCHRG